jgi:hypothetical protein
MRSCKKIRFVDQSIACLKRIKSQISKDSFVLSASFYCFHDLDNQITRRNLRISEIRSRPHDIREANAKLVLYANFEEQTKLLYIVGLDLAIFSYLEKRNKIYHYHKICGHCRVNTPIQESGHTHEQKKYSHSIPTKKGSLIEDRILSSYHFISNAIEHIDMKQITPTYIMKCKIYFFPFLSALAAFFLSVPLNFLARFFLCFRCCLEGFSILFAMPIRTFL